jgi:hypothetical protein
MVFPIPNLKDNRAIIYFPTQSSHIVLAVGHLTTRPILEISLSRRLNGGMTKKVIEQAPMSVVSPDWKAVLSVVRNEITPGMWVAGGVVIDGWLEKDPDIIELAGEDAANLACLVFAAMRREQSAALRVSASTEN